MDWYVCERVTDSKLFFVQTAPRAFWHELTREQYRIFSAIARTKELPKPTRDKVASVMIAEIIAEREKAAAAPDQENSDDL